MCLSLADHVDVVVADLGRSVVGIEADGYMEGAIFVINPSVDGWLEAISQPLPQQDVMDSGRPSRAKKPRAPSAPRQDPLAGFKLHAEYKGYGPWRVSWTCLIDEYG